MHTLASMLFYMKLGVPTDLPSSSSFCVLYTILCKGYLHTQHVLASGRTYIASHTLHCQMVASCSQDRGPGGSLHTEKNNLRKGIRLTAIQSAGRRGQHSKSHSFGSFDIVALYLLIERIDCMHML